MTAPGGAVFDVRDPALAAMLSEAAGTPVHLLRLGRGCFDAMAVSLLTTAMVAAVEGAHGGVLGPARFRANILVDADAGTTEGAWLGQSLAIGDAACLHAGWATPRCAMVGIGAETGEREPGVVRTVAQRFGNRVGGFCSVRQPGPVRVGDAVRLVERAD